MSDFDYWTWASVSAGALARGRQCFVLQHGTDPIRTGRYRVAWLDDDGAALAWWTGNTADLMGGWESERSLVLTTWPEAREALRGALKSFGDRVERRVEIVEMI